jgi:hypothetical protein
MAHWVGGTGAWNTTNANNWTNNPPAIFTATCAGTTLTVTSADFSNIANGMTVWSNNYTILGTIAGGSYPTYTLSGLGGTIPVAEVMQAATIPGSLPSASNIAIFTTIQGALGLNLAPFTVTLSGSLASNGLQISGSALTLAGSPTLAINDTISISAGTTWNATGSVTLSDNSTGNGFNITTNGVTINSAITLDYSVNPTTSNLTLVDNLTLGNTTTFTLTRGGVVLGSNTFSMGLFSTSGTGTRRINFGTGKILLTGTGTVWTSTAINNFTTLPASAAKLVEVTTSAGATTINSGLLSEANAVDFTFLAGSGTVTFGAGTKRSLDFSAYIGNLGSNTAQTIYGDVHFGSGTFTGGLTGGWTFASTSATPRTITGNGRTITFNIVFNGVGGKWVLQDALLQSTARSVTHTNGTLDLNAQTLTVGTDYTTATGTKNLTFNGGALVCPSTSTAFNNAAPTNYTTSVGITNPVPGKIRTTSTSAKTFVGGGSTFNCTLDQAGTGTLSILGSNTFNDIINSVQPAIVQFTAGTTTTFVNGFNLRGTAGNLITIRSISAATHTLSKASGTVSCDYLSITNSIATGGASWYAGANSTNVSGNTGWIFTASPGVTVNVTGVFASGVIGTATVAAAANTLTTGPPATGSVGDVSVTTGGGVNVSVDVTGVQATGSVGDVTVAAKANVSLTGVQADGFIGDSTVAAKANVSLTGVEATGSVGDVTVAAKANVSLTGVQANGFIGDSTVAAKANVSLTGVEASGAVGDVTVAVQNPVQVSVTGVEATGSVGTLDVTGKANTTLTGVEASGAVGTVTTQSSYYVTGVSATVTLGDVTISAGARVSLTGVQATGYIGPVLVWSVINDNQTPNWTPVNDSQTVTWTPVNDDNTVIWTQIPT